MPTKKQRTMFIAIIIIGVMSYSLIQLEIIKLGFKHQSYINKKRQLIEQENQLKLEYANAMLLSNIEQELKEKHGFIKAEEKNFRYITK